MMRGMGNIAPNKLLQNEESQNSNRVSAYIKHIMMRIESKTFTKGLTMRVVDPIFYACYRLSHKIVRQAENLTTKSNLLSTRGPKRATGGGAHLRHDLALGQRSSGKAPQRWRAMGNCVRWDRLGESNPLLSYANWLVLDGNAFIMFSTKYASVVNQFTAKNNGQYEMTTVA